MARFMAASCSVGNPTLIVLIIFFSFFQLDRNIGLILRQGGGLWQGGRGKGFTPLEENSPMGVYWDVTLLSYAILIVAALFT